LDRYSTSATVCDVKIFSWCKKIFVASILRTLTSDPLDKKITFQISMENLVARQAMYVKCNIKARSCNYCCNGKAISIIYSECVFVALGIQHAMRM
jgi:hypothetical protein